MMYANMARLYQ
jgi:hypothetical protein